jgi:hypothetical protein
MEARRGWSPTPAFPGLRAASFKQAVSDAPRTNAAYLPAFCNRAPSVIRS